MKRMLVVGSVALLLLVGGGYAWFQMHGRGYA
jgi:hypothetical protein